MEPAIFCTMREIVNVVPALERLGKVELPIKVSIQIRRIDKAIHDEHHIYLEEEAVLLERYSERDEEGNIVRPNLLDEKGKELLDPEGNPVPNPAAYTLKDPEKFYEEREELLDAVVTLRFDKIPLELVENLEVSYDDAEALAFLIEH